MFVKYFLPVPVFHFWPKLTSTLQRGLSAIAEHVLWFIVVVFRATFEKLEEKF